MWFRGDAPYELDNPNPDNTALVTQNTSKPLVAELPGILYPTPTLPGKKQHLRTHRTVRNPKIELKELETPHVTMPFYQKNQQKTRSYAPSKPNEGSFGETENGK
jgi:hypothetical protein